ncbi:unnamed protein product [Paramecium octaurelia]|uniref:Uncharacterized protein n=1 Tax=Paramecium octaurelia TaxID=43137 RepID=A0A8S1X6Y6_PAROT|nr:unnamed protein product [Paramecium octaurelia]
MIFIDWKHTTTQFQTLLSMTHDTQFKLYLSIMLQFLQIHQFNMRINISLKSIHSFQIVFQFLVLFFSKEAHRNMLIEFSNFCHCYDTINDFPFCYILPLLSPLILNH